MRLKKLLKNVNYKEIKGSLDIEISGICSDSRVVAPNNLFIARRGKQVDATRCIYDAVEAGAIAIATDVYDPFLKNVTQIICEDLYLIEPDLASNYYQKPSSELFSVAITGTNGKTTTSYLIKHIFDTVNFDCGLLGTVEYILKDTKISAKLTTPDSITTQKYLREMINLGLKSFCIEASSHGIEQSRLKNIDFDIAAFTNLTIDHLDYHLTFENYKNAKKKLFDNLNEKAYAVINLDDKHSLDIVKDTKAKILTISIEKQADLFATNIKCSLKGTFFTLHYKDKKIDFFSQLIGKFNIYNILSAIAAGIIINIDVEKLPDIIKSFNYIPGRLEKVENDKNLNIYIDYAHSDDALRNILSTLQELKNKRVINVFGCGGDRDKSKRPLMAKVSELYSDLSIVTSDNPRSEDPEKIIEDVISGFSKKSEYIVEKDRKKAIEIAIKLAKQDDIVIITGKGHETYQILKNTTIDFDDKKIIRQICASQIG